NCLHNQLVYLDLRNNGNIIEVGAFDNTDLTCIYVDDKSYAENAPYWSKDPTAHWVETEAECDALDIEDFVFRDVNVYPNPVKNQLSIEGLKGNAQIALYDIQGKTVFTKSTSLKKPTFEVSSLQPGVYFLQVVLQNTAKTFKIVKS